MKKFYGVITAMVTPFDEHDKVDTGAIRQIVKFLLEKGIHCLYPTGTTGELLQMTNEEREIVAATVVDEVANRAPVFIHAGAARLKDTLRLVQHAHRIGADGVGVVTPFFHTLSERAMIEFYCEVSACVPYDFPIYIYVIPQLASNDVLPETISSIADRCKNIVGVKYSGADMQRVNDYLKVRNGHFSVVFGKDDLFLPALSIGCDGTVSGCSNAVPEVFVNVYKAFQANEYKKASEAQKIASEVVRILRYGKDMGCFKSVMNTRGIYAGHMRKPLLDLEEEDEQNLLKAIKKYLPND